MRIGIEAQRIFRAKKHGMDIYALELIRHLQKIDDQNQYFIFVKGGEDPCLQSKDNFTIVELGGATYADWEQISLARAAKKYRLDLLHCTSNTAPFSISCPLVLTVHDIIYLEKLSIGGTLYQQLGHFYRKWVVPKVIKKAKTVITVSQFEQDRIAKVIPEIAQNVQVTYNGLSDYFFAKATEEEKVYIKKRYQLPDRYLFYLGNPVPKKNMKNTLDAYRIYRERTEHPLPLVMVECTPAHLKNLLQQLGASDIESYIYLTGYVPHRELPKLYQASSLFLYPSLRESFGIPVIEGMASKVPVITSDRSSLPEVAGGAAVLVDPTKPQFIAEAIIELMNDELLRRQWVQKGIQRASEFTWTTTAQKTLKIYQSLDL